MLLLLKWDEMKPATVAADEDELTVSLLSSCNCALLHLAELSVWLLFGMQEDDFYLPEKMIELRCIYFESRDDLRVRGEERRGRQEEEEEEANERLAHEVRSKVQSPVECVLKKRIKCKENDFIP